MLRIWSIGIAVILICCVAAAFMAWRVWAGIQSRSWLPVQGVLQRVSLEKAAITPFESLKVEYAYEVAEHSYTSSRISYRIRDSRPESDLRRAEGHAVTVYYNPKSPEQAVLFQGTSSSDIAFALIPFLVSCAAGFVLFMFAKAEGFRNQLLGVAAK